MTILYDYEIHKCRDTQYRRYQDTGTCSLTTTSTLLFRWWAFYQAWSSAFCCQVSPALHQFQLVITYLASLAARASETPGMLQVLFSSGRYSIRNYPPLSFWRVLFGKRCSDVEPGAVFVFVQYGHCD